MQHLIYSELFDTYVTIRTMVGTNSDSCLINLEEYTCDRSVLRQGQTQALPDLLGGAFGSKCHLTYDSTDNFRPFSNLTSELSDLFALAFCICCYKTSRCFSIKRH